ncbi:MAG: hypothetical protein MJ177_08685 [Clostridia bacterium]|nr:hypothetical protein [Clostridia bacterium]
MKKTVSLILAVIILLGTFGICAFAATPATVYVTIADEKGNLAVAHEIITVKDSDKDGKLTISDALYYAHEEFYEGGAKAGYKAGETEYGISLVKLWGIANGGSYGYYINDNSAYSLADTVKDGDNVYAFIYTDTMNFSDTYSYFEEKEMSFRTYTFNEVTLYKYTFDANWKPVKEPVKGAVITIDGEESKYVTDENGKVKIAVLKSGKHTVSAKGAKGENITAPVCKLNCEKGKFTDVLSYICLVVINFFSSRKK